MLEHILQFFKKEKKKHTDPGSMEIYGCGVSPGQNGSRGNMCTRHVQSCQCTAAHRARQHTRQHLQKQREQASIHKEPRLGANQHVQLPVHQDACRKNAVSWKQWHESWLNWIKVLWYRFLCHCQTVEASGDTESSTSHQYSTAFHVTNVTWGHQGVWDVKL